MKIWIDADAAPTDVKEIVFKASKRLEIETILVANRPVVAPPAYAQVRSVTVPEGADQADRYIAMTADFGDLAITADVPLASDLVDGGLYVIDPRGVEYSQDTIASRLSMRNFMDDLRGEGMVVGRTSPYSATDKKAFAATFDRLLTRAIRADERRRRSQSHGTEQPADSDGTGDTAAPADTDRLSE
ncbi:hypothetical protein K227x_52160 [Rubripirellula lacrimiformis]|uniref:UPF0178 protein K227x_52160 n=1 Tax=Rubripirellula lacrimiformis TaxID=1930273 RepID=A0A517NI37_9BACT|nr:DUF188 domain-containing protein [Rubripirellula lacrimiformis]QDT06800.1 hypothetical protein K227x_52160 [Rubripirellula lacrimiformis]